MKNAAKSYLYCAVGLLLSINLLAQPNWHIGIFNQYEIKIPDLRSLQLKGVNPGLQFGLTLDYPKSKVNIYLTSRWERLREGKREIFLFNFGTRETIKQDNLIIGPGLTLNFGPRRQLQPLFGVEIFVGIPLRSQYEFFGPEGMTSFFLPSYLEVKDGTDFLAGWATYAGVLTEIGTDLSCQLKLGFGRADQTFSGAPFSRPNYQPTILSGSYATATLGLIYQL